jgi:hypothetical protein
MGRPWKTPKGTELLITDLRGKDYMEVKYRLVWFREEKPNWSILTEIVLQDANSAVVKASILDDQGRVMATAHKHENKQGFADFREKAETGAIGRALAHCGYGTQFAPDLDEGERLADSPVQRVSHPIANERGRGTTVPVSGPPPATKPHIVPSEPVYGDNAIPQHCGEDMLVSKFCKDEATDYYYCAAYKQGCKAKAGRM